ncbi:TlpA disulfide reductase family protein [Mangrovivirga sp. M17]|uniref:TlpA disulfide reductase family protein n=1 Tax=Mangrovivirga halotolerans TaxID=2993936 RepID=A0ABT3RL31_9BACT|nr:TlpA disulfide reductase family protein [Mangrovivirga halotolerans]MCX2742317.1 TlpA disulfide reductase family protein [Mangrovivirga halotolerans]
MKLLKFSFILFLLTAIISCNETGNDTEESNGKYSGKVQGEIINGSAVAQVTVSRQENNRFIVIDTLQVDEDGNFEGTLTVSQPAFVAFNFGNNEQVFIPYDGDDIEMSIDMDNPKESVKIEGSDDYNYYNEVSEMVKNFQMENRNLMLAYQKNASKKNMQAADSLAEVIRKKQKGFQEELKNKINDILPSIVGIEAARLLPVGENVDFMRNLVAKYEEAYPDADFYMPFKDQVGKEAKLAIGAEAPDFALPTPDGDTVRLSDFRGEYVLVDFWAQWCKPCRMENPNVVAAYDKYKGKGFQILGVSLDRSRDKWLQAIEEDNLTWTQVSELSATQSKVADLYNITGIPFSILVDPEGKIVAKNLRGQSLHDKLSEIYDTE